MDKFLLLSILEKAQKMVAIQSNMFIWTDWKNSQEAIDELQKIKQEIERDNYSSISALEIIFGPTGPMQELSIDSGWTNEFILLAEDIDKAIESFHNEE
jgi:hypothetical protein